MSTTSRKSCFCNPSRLLILFPDSLTVCRNCSVCKLSIRSNWLLLCKQIRFCVVKEYNTLTKIVPVKKKKKKNIRWTRPGLTKCQHALTKSRYLIGNSLRFWIREMLLCAKLRCNSLWHFSRPSIWKYKTPNQMNRSVTLPSNFPPANSFFHFSKKCHHVRLSHSLSVLPEIFDCCRQLICWDNDAQTSLLFLQFGWRKSQQLLNFWVEKSPAIDEDDCARHPVQADAANNSMPTNLEKRHSNLFCTFFDFSNWQKAKTGEKKNGYPTGNFVVWQIQLLDVNTFLQIADILQLVTLENRFSNVDSRSFLEFLFAQI